MNFLFYLVKWLTGSKRQSYGDDVIQVVKPRLDVDSVIKEIIRIGDEDDPFYVCEVNDIIRRHEEWEAAMPRVTTHYAVKCNSSKVVLQTLAALGTGFDCASKEEIRTVLSLGVRPDRIIFAHPTKMVSHLKYAADVGVTMMTFDNDYELQKNQERLSTGQVRSIYIILLIRIKYDDLSARYLLGQKYGCDHEKEARDLLLKASSLKLDVVGVCFHIGSSSKDHSVFRRAIAAARQVYDEAADLGFNFKLLDIGGGFPGEKKEVY
ncbi:hypothetical protein NQ318_005401 [Aromia moschata]|uniref:ornithine decarboxylase n=1 Tax=Aromia moschata TaxID=1265417 RepID=A0AAV8YY81_9CUCU|nr:hypothetical protein NQ318_005401 [Aromia moschata]